LQLYLLGPVAVGVVLVGIAGEGCRPRLVAYPLDPVAVEVAVAALGTVGIGDALFHPVGTVGVCRLLVPYRGGPEPVSLIVAVARAAIGRGDAGPVAVAVVAVGYQYAALGGGGKPVEIVVYVGRGVGDRFVNNSGRPGSLHRSFVQNSDEMQGR